MKNLHFLFFVSVILLAPITLIAQSNCFDSRSYSLTEGAKTAYESLEKETTFALGGIGYSGQTSDGGKALRSLLQEESGKMALFKLSTENAGVGGLYGLVGLKTLKSDCFQNAYDAFTKLPDKEQTKGRHETLAPGEVGHMSGCIYWVQNRKEIAKDIYDGKFDMIVNRVERQIRAKPQESQKKK